MKWILSDSDGVGPFGTSRAGRPIHKKNFSAFTVSFAALKDLRPPPAATVLTVFSHLNHGGSLEHQPNGNSSGEPRMERRRETRSLPGGRGKNDVHSLHQTSCLFFQRFGSSDWADVSKSLKSATGFHPLNVRDQNFFVPKKCESKFRELNGEALAMEKARINAAK